MVLLECFVLREGIWGSKYPGSKKHHVVTPVAAEMEKLNTVWVKRSYQARFIKFGAWGLHNGAKGDQQ